LRDHLTALGHRVHAMAAEPGLPDLVFTANGGIVIGDRGLVPRFRHPERAPEAEHFAAVMRDLGVREIRTSRYVNEGEGDFLLVGGTLLAGTGLRSDPRGVDEVAEFFDLPVVRLCLVDPRFYHLDTALGRLDDRTVAYLPSAFDRRSQGILRDLFPDAIPATEQDAASLGLNLISDGRTVLMAPGCRHLAGQATERGFRVIAVATDELRKAGGGAKCCVLELHPQSA
jgi:ornithine--oxo-acid transaminase